MTITINLINPNTSLAMTSKIADSARSVACNDTVILANSPQHGPESIECARDEVLASSALLDVIINGEERKVSGHIIACFGDPGMDAAKELAKAPVIGIAQAAFHVASLISHKFSIVTTLARTIPTAEELLNKYGFYHQCASIRCVDVPVLELEETSETLFLHIKQECLLAIKEDKAECIVLGCAGMSDLVYRLEKELSIPIVDGVKSAVKIVESLAMLDLQTSKKHIYATPPQKKIIGRYQHMN